MLVVNSVTHATNGLITVNFSVDRADIDTDVGSEDYGIRVIRTSDNVAVTSPNSFRTVNSGVGISTGNVTGFYNTSGTYIARVVPTTGGDIVNDHADSQPFTIGVITMATAPTEPVIVPVGAPTQKQKPFRYTMPYKTQASHNGRLVAEGYSKDSAFTLLVALAKVTGSSVSATARGLTLTVNQAIADAPSLGGTGSTSDAIIVCHRAADDSTVNVPIADMLLTYKLGGTFFIDTSNADIIAIASAVQDKYGDGGFAPLPTSKYMA